MPEVSLDHVQIERPEALRSRGGAWFALGDRALHVGVEADFEPARKAHVALREDPFCNASSSSWARLRRL